jgi:REP element-mobilizing transposase RayT
MARIPRKELIDQTEVGVYHCVQRAVRRAWLCGQDPLTGKNFDHRKVWIQQRLEFLAGQFSIDICSLAIMSNHIHLVVRNRPDIASQWTDQEVARRWWNLFPQRKNEDGSPAQPEAHELDLLMADTMALQERRQRLSSISWLMRCLAEPIARQANREDGCTGRFWEGRYKCQRLLDEAAVLACSVYVDLNPIRAGVAETPETSPFTSAYERIQARGEPLAQGQAPVADGAPATPRDGWLSPVELQGEVQPEPQTPERRASNKGFLPLKVEQYLALLDWTGRQARADKRGQIPGDLLPILERLQLSTETWVETVRNFGRWFHRAVGRVDSLAAEAARRGRQWLQGVSHSRAAFA